MSAEELQALRFDWPTWARPEQLPPDERDDWDTFLFLAGRGAGKTRAASEWARRMAMTHAGCRIGIIARTAGDVRDVCVEGESGLLSVHPPSEAPLFEPSKRRIVWRNGSLATTFSADEPDLLRGPQFHYLWCDELAAWARLDETWSNARLALRLGTHPRAFISTTPRPLPLIRELLKNPRTIVRRGSTFDNACNLAPSALAEFRARYEGTRTGRQELFAELLDDVPGALWTRSMLDDNRVRPEQVPELTRVVVAIDPAVTSGEDSDSTGIIVAGRSREKHFYVLRDATCKASPLEWARRAVAAFHTFHADRIVAEVNNGGDLVEATLRIVRKDIPFRKVHASRGKRVRAEPIAALYEQGRVHHVGGFPALEDEQCSFTPDGYVGSPDRVDALVWSLTELQKGGGGLAALQALAGVAEKPTPVESLGALHGGSYLTPAGSTDGAGAKPRGSAELCALGRERGWR